MPRPKPDPHAIEPFLRAEGLRELSITNYVGVIRRFEWSGQPDPAAWLAGCVQPTTPKRTVNCWRSAIRYYLTWKGLTWSQPPPSLKRQPRGKERQGLEADQLEAYLKAAEQQLEPYRTMLLLLPKTGLRSFELCALSVENIDLAGNLLRVHGKRGVYREVPLTKVTRQLLGSFLAVHPRTTGPIFRRPTTDNPLTPRDLRTVTLQIQRQDPTHLFDLTPHMLRHTAATHMLAHGVPAKVIQRVLGHASASSLDPYLHPGKAELRKAMETLG